MVDIFRTLIMPDAFVWLAREIAAAFGPGGEGMWTTGLSADGQEPASHFISSGYIPEAFACLAPLQVWEIGEDGWHMSGSEPGDPAAVYAAASGAGLACTLAEIEALFAAADVNEQEPFVAMDRLGIKLVQADEP